MLLSWRSGFQTLGNSRLPTLSDYVILPETAAIEDREAFELEVILSHPNSELLAGIVEYRLYTEEYHESSSQT